MRLSKENYQLFGITCLWIASKYEEIYPPRMRCFVDVTANTYSICELKHMESRVLEALSFGLVRTTTLSLLNTIVNSD